MFGRDSDLPHLPSSGTETSWSAINVIYDVTQASWARECCSRNTPGFRASGCVRVWRPDLGPAVLPAFLALSLKHLVEGV